MRNYLNLRILMVIDWSTKEQQKLLQPKIYVGLKSNVKWLVLFQEYGNVYILIHYFLVGYTNTKVVKKRIAIELNCPWMVKSNLTNNFGTNPCHKQTIFFFFFLQILSSITISSQWHQVKVLKTKDYFTNFNILKKSEAPSHLAREFFPNFNPNCKHYGFQIRN